MVNISVLNRKQIFRFTFLLVLLFLGILVYFYRVPIGTFLKERLTFLERKLLSWQNRTLW